MVSVVLQFSNLLGLGILVVSGVPGFTEKRKRLLPLARRLAVQTTLRNMHLWLIRSCLRKSSRNWNLLKALTHLGGHTVKKSLMEYWV